MTRVPTEKEEPGDWIRRWRRQQGLTQEQFAERLEISRYSVNQIERRKRRITGAMALKLGSVTRVPPEFFMDLQRDIDLELARRDA